MEITRRPHLYLMLTILGLVVATGLLFVSLDYRFIFTRQQPAPRTKLAITSFAECVAAGYPVMESYPEQCAANGQTFVRTLPPASAPSPVLSPSPDLGPTGDGGGMVACTMEAKLCPDGSAVGRSGPRCEFAPCPGE